MSQIEFKRYAIHLYGCTLNVDCVEVAVFIRLSISDNEDLTVMYVGRCLPGITCS